MVSNALTGLFNSGKAALNRTDYGRASPSVASTLRGMPMKMHASITYDRVMAACHARIASLDNPGFCLACGAEAYDCEPDARRYICLECGEPEVYGAEELLFLLA